MAFTEDLDIFFETSEFAEDAVLAIASTGKNIDVKVIYDDPTIGVDMFDTTVETDRKFLMIKTSDLGDAKRGDTLTFSFGVFSIAHLRHDGTGISHLQLKTITL